MNWKTEQKIHGKILGRVVGWGNRDGKKGNLKKSMKMNP